MACHVAWRTQPLHRAEATLLAQQEEQRPHLSLTSTGSQRAGPLESKRNCPLVPRTSILRVHRDDHARMPRRERQGQGASFSGDEPWTPEWVGSLLSSSAGSQDG